LICFGVVDLNARESSEEGSVAFGISSSPMLATDTLSGSNGVAALERSLMALTALRALHLGGSQQWPQLSLDAVGGAALERSLMALTALHTLNLNSETLYGLCVFVCALGFLSKNALLWTFTSLGADSCLRDEGYAAVVRCLTVLTALQYLDLSGKPVILVR
jgi:hypothetical protein